MNDLTLKRLRNDLGVLGSSIDRKLMQIMHYSNPDCLPNAPTISTELKMGLVIISINKRATINFQANLWTSKDTSLDVHNLF